MDNENVTHLHDILLFIDHEIVRSMDGAREGETRTGGLNREGDWREQKRKEYGEG